MLSRRGFVAAAATAGMTASAAGKQSELSFRNDNRDWWKPANKKTKHTLPSEERMIARLNDAWLALKAIVRAHVSGRLDG
jgi:hypothetical protein